MNKSGDSTVGCVRLPIPRATEGPKPWRTPPMDRDGAAASAGADTVLRAAPASGRSAVDSAEAGDAIAAGQPLDESNERTRLVEAMDTAGWVQAKAARLLGLSARQIGYALRKHGVPVKKF